MARKQSTAQTPATIETPYTDAQIARGDWNPLWDTLRTWDPAFMEAYLAFRSVPHRNGPLPPKVKELVLIAINVATTHMYGAGVRRHMQNALKAGATREEILEVIQLTTVLGIHACNLGVPILAEEIERFAASAGDAKKPRKSRRSGAKS
ncbi:carboxymuconolactone decarboxylase family protein [Paraburkholderia phymatum]|uniref:carboxymuconolactone decarboxylase family protein n=1 Tax=Paraburkholderia phymatum TaxID=148447 RepID=UPI00317FDF5C